MKMGRVGLGMFLSASLFSGGVCDVWAQAGNEEVEEVEVTESTAEIPDEEEAVAGFAVDYTNIFYGPSLQSPSSVQPDADGNPDMTRPIYMKNFLSVGYAVSEKVAVTGTMYWLHQPVHGQQFTMQDPSVRVSHNSLFKTDWGLNLYSDMRVHFGVTSGSRDRDMLASLQNFNILSWKVGQTPLTLAMRTSARGYFYGSQGEGFDTELYLAPDVNYQISDTLALTVLYEMGADHWFRDPWNDFYNDGTDLQPGIAWNVTPNLVINPYLTLYTGHKVSLSTTSMGMFLNWTIL